MSLQKFAVSSLSFVAVLIATFGCSKPKPNPNPPFPTATANFYVKKPCNYAITNDSVQFIDSIFFFMNLSDSGTAIKYKWDFGDYNFSTDKNPVHGYSNPGNYTVTLYTFWNNIPTDTFSRNVRVIIGQKEFKTGDTYNRAVDLDVTSDKGIISIFNHYSGTNQPSYNLFAVDSFLRQKWIKPLNPTAVRLSSIKKLNANEFILSGNYQPGNTGQFALSKINSNGDLVWEKYISNLAGTNVCTIPTSDGNLITIGSTPPSNAYTVIVKCDANGDEIWRKLFDGIQTSTLIRYSNNILEIPGGYLFASLTPSTNQIVLTRLDLNGNINGQTFVSSGNIGTIFETGVAKCNDRYLVFATNTRYVFMFDNNLNFIDSRMVAQTGINHATADNNYFYVAEGNFQYGFVTQLSTTGVPYWSSIINNVIPINCSSAFSGATRYCKKACVYNGEIITFSEGQNNTSGPMGFSVYLEKFLTTGLLK